MDEREVAERLLAEADQYNQMDPELFIQAAMKAADLAISMMLKTDNPNELRSLARSGFAFAVSATERYVTMREVEKGVAKLADALVKSGAIPKPPSVKKSLN